MEKPSKLGTIDEDAPSVGTVPQPRPKKHRRIRFPFALSLRRLRKHLQAWFARLRQKLHLNPDLPYAQVSVSSPCTALMLSVLNDAPGGKHSTGWWRLLRQVQGQMYREVGHSRWKELETLEDCDEECEVMYQMRKTKRVVTSPQCEDKLKGDCSSSQKVKPSSDHNLIS